MKYAILSDVHANLEALEAVLAKADQQGAERLLCLGDVVGYHADPNACVALLRERGALCIAGNHDRAAVRSKSCADFGEPGRRAIRWTQKVLTPQHRCYLEGLPGSLLVDQRLLLIHGSLHPEPNDDVHLSNETRVRKSFQRLVHGSYGARLCFFGHTHRGIVYRYVESDDAVTVLLQREGSLESAAQEDAWYLINPGSVGQPRDGDMRASFVIYDSEAGSLRYHRVLYDRDTCMEKARRAGLLTARGDGLLHRSAQWLRSHLPRAEY